MATAAAAIIARARREIQHHFFAADAVRADRAVPFAPSGGVMERQFARMLDAGIVRREGADRYWIDVVAYDIDLRARHRRVWTALIVLCAVLAGALLALTISKG